MEIQEAVGRVIRNLRTSQKKTLQQVAGEADYDAGNLSKIERGQLGYSEDALSRIARALNHDVSDIYAQAEIIMAGESPGAGDRAPAAPKAKTFTPDFLVQEGDAMYAVQVKSTGGETARQLAFTMVPRYHIKVSAGDGVIVQEETKKDEIAFRAQWLQDHGLRPRDLVVVYAKGDSMLERIHDGDILLVDTSQRTVKDGKVYALRYGDDVKVKRLLLRHDGAVIIHSDNPSPRYPDEVVTADSIDELHIIGRVVWIGGEV